MDIFPSDRMCFVMAYAHNEAARRGSEVIGTEDILYGIAKEGSGMAAYALHALNINLAKRTTVPTIPWTIELGRCELAKLTGEARNLMLRAIEIGLRYRTHLPGELPPYAWYGTGHVLLAMLGELNESGTQLLLAKLEEAGCTTEDLQNALSKFLGDVAM